MKLGYLHGNEDKDRRRPVMKASQFAQLVLGKVGGSQVYIEPKKAKKFVDLEKVE